MKRARNRAHVKRADSILRGLSLGYLIGWVMGGGPKMSEKDAQEGVRRARAHKAEGKP